MEYIYNSEDSGGGGGDGGGDGVRRRVEGREEEVFTVLASCLASTLAFSVCVFK